MEIIDAWNANWGVFLAATAGRHVAQFGTKMDPALLRVIMAGQQLGAVDLKQLEEVRTRQWRTLAAIFRDYDVLLCPTTAITAPALSAQDADFEAADAQGRLHGFDMCAPFNNIAPCPALSVPSGLDGNGLPTAVQIVGHRFDDPSVLAVGAAIERLRPFAACPLIAGH
jgi:Asp-tRNA(Asn)/Glu-tRNA(Gln) amidotransferase A subunit family amidase